MQCVRIVGVSVSVMLCCFFSVLLMMSGVSSMSYVLGYCCQSGSRVWCFFLSRAGFLGGLFANSFVALRTSGGPFEGFEGSVGRLSMVLFYF